MPRDNIRPYPLTAEEGRLIRAECNERARLGQLSTPNDEDLPLMLGPQALNLLQILPANILVLFSFVSEFFYWKGRRDGARLAEEALQELGKSEDGVQ